MRKHGGQRRNGRYARMLAPAAALAIAAGLSACGHTATAVAYPGTCHSLQAMNLPVVKEMIDNAESSNGLTSDSDAPMTTRQMAAIGQDAQALNGYAAQTAGPFRSVMQAEATEFAAAAHSPNGTVTNDQSTQTDAAYKQIAALCGGELS
jgi:hypothetical protein